MRTVTTKTVFVIEIDEGELEDLRQVVQYAYEKTPSQSDEEELAAKVRDALDAL